MDSERKFNLIGKYVNIYIIDYEKRAYDILQKRKFGKFPYIRDLKNNKSVLEFIESIKNNTKCILYEIHLSQLIIDAIRTFNILTETNVYFIYKNLLFDVADDIFSLRIENTKNLYNDKPRWVSNNYCPKYNINYSTNSDGCDMDGNHYIIEYMFDSFDDFDHNTSNIITMQKIKYLCCDNTHIISFDKNPHTFHKYIHILYTLLNYDKLKIKFNLCKNKKIDKIKTKLKISMFGYIKTALYNNDITLSLFNINCKFIEKLIYVLYCNNICAELIYIIFKYLRFN